MAFGLSNAPKTFQRAMNGLLGHLRFRKIFLDAVLIHSNTIIVHNVHLSTVFRILRENNVRINFEKSKFSQKKVNYLRHSISEQGIKANLMQHDLLDKIVTTPKNVKQLQKTLGVINWFRPYIPNLSTKIAGVTEKVKKGKFAEWNEKDTTSLKNLIKEIKNNTELKHPDFSEKFHVYSDASNEGFSCVIRQDKGLVALYSKKYTKSENNYSVVEKECMALVKGLQHFRNLLLNSKIILHTDSKNIVYIKELHTSRYQKWKMLLEEFDYEIEHLPGIHTSADYFSRNFMIQPSDNWNHMQSLKFISTWQQNSKYPTPGFLAANPLGNELIREDIAGIRIFLTKNKKIYLFDDISYEVLDSLHEHCIHPGINKLYETIKSELCCKKLLTKIKSISSKCVDCLRNKNQNNNQTLMRNFIIEKNKEITIASDILGPIIDQEYTKNKRLYILTIIDVFSRYTKLYILKSLESKEVTSKFANFIEKYFKPQKIISDQGRQYSLKVFQKFCSDSQILHKMTFAYTPTANGIAERINSSIHTILQINRKKTSLTEAVRQAEYHLNFTFNRKLIQHPPSYI